MGQLLVNQSLPPDLRDYNRVLDKKGVQQLLDTVARKYPEQYAEIAKNLSDVGRKVAYHSGGFGVGLESLRQTQAAKIARINLARDLQQVYSNRKLTPDQTDAAVLETVGKYQRALPGDVFKEAVAANNPLALQAVSGARGSQTNVNSLIGADLLYEDHRGRPVPIPILRNYAMGLSPAEHFAGAFGARKGTLDLKKATADAGFLCLCENTEVRMADFSIKKIKDIVVGDWVLGADMQGMTFPVRVTAVFNNGDRELHTFVFRYGKSRTRTVEITATTAHKALARYRRISKPRREQHTHIREVDKFQLGDMVNKPARRHSLIAPQGFVDAYPMRDEPLAWVIGLLIGDGGLTQNHISLSAGDTRIVDLARQQLEPLGFSVRKIKGHDCEYCISDNAKGSVQGTRQRYPVNRLWRRLSELDLRGCTASQKQLPEEVATWSNASVARLLQGIMSSDGCVSRSNNSTVPTVHIAMTSATLVNQIAELLAIRFGIYGQLSDVRTKGRAVMRFPERGYTANHDLRKLVINDRESVLKFTEIIGSDGDRGDRLTEKTAAIAAAPRLDKFGFHFLRSVVVGIGNTMDLEVDHPDHLFVLANGAIVSNSKQLAQSVHRLLVTAHDSDSPYDESQPRGLEVSTDDADNEGSLLAHPVGGYGRNTVLTPKILKELRAAGHDNILVRSPTVGGPDDGGVYARDAGYREKGGLAPRGDMVGLAGSQAISEPVTQGQISSKHCLKRGTLVRMADWTVKAIEDIVVGDMVLGADIGGRVFGVRVVNTFDNGLRDCVCTNFTSGGGAATLFSTLDHKILTTTGVDGDSKLLDAKVSPIADCVTDTVFATVFSCGELGLLKISRGRMPLGDTQYPTHDIEVDHPDHLFVLANGLIVSNSGGVAGASAGAIGGFAAINAMVQAPEIFPGGAVHSQLDGRVEHIVEAPQGGHYMTVGGQQHYIPRGATLTVQKGDTVEAGDTVTEGIPNPSEIVRHKGVGEGRRYFIDSFRKVLKNSQIGAHRRNVELLARGLLNHVRLTDEVGDWGPDDVVPYQTLESQWSPRAGYMVAPAKSLVGHYLEKPILHYSVGTKIRPSMVKKLDQYGVKSIYAHRDAPPFEPEMVRAMMNTAHDPDWQTKMLGSYQQSSVLEAARRGGMSDNDSTSYVPSLASSPTFGAAKIMKGWNPADIGRTPVDLTTKPKITSLLD